MVAGGTRGTQHGTGVSFNRGHEMILDPRSAPGCRSSCASQPRPQSLLPRRPLPRRGDASPLHRHPNQSRAPWRPSRHLGGAGGVTRVPCDGPWTKATKLPRAKPFPPQPSLHPTIGFVYVYPACHSRSHRTPRSLHHCCTRPRPPRPPRPLPRGHGQRRRRQHRLHRPAPPRCVV